MLSVGSMAFLLPQQCNNVVLLNYSKEKSAASTDR